MNKFCIHLLAFTTVALLLPTPAAAGILDTIDAIDGAGPVPNATLPGIALFLRHEFLLMLDIIAAFLLVRSGLKLIQSQEEDKLTRARRTIGGTAVGIMLAHLSVRIVEIFYGTTAAPVGGVLTPDASALMLSVEVGGIIRWITTLVAVLGILMIVATGIRAIGGFGKEDSITHIRETVVGTVTGMFLIIVSGAIKATFGLPETMEPGGPHDPSVLPIVERVVGIVHAILDYMAIIAVAIVLYAAFLMIINLGDEERFSKGRSLIFRALIGLVVILLSNTFVSFLMSILA